MPSVCTARRKRRIASLCTRTRIPRSSSGSSLASGFIDIEALEVYSIDRALITALAERLDRRMAFSLSITDRDLYISIGSDTLTGGVTRHAVV